MRQPRGRSGAAGLPSRLSPSEKVTSTPRFVDYYYDSAAGTWSDERPRKQRPRSPFNAVSAQFEDTQVDRRMLALQEALQAEKRAEADGKTPHSIRDRKSAFYNVVTHEVSDSCQLSRLEVKEAARRFGRYDAGHAEADLRLRVRDAEAHCSQEVRRWNRHLQGQEQRDYDILTHRALGSGPGKTPRSRPSPSPWERAVAGRSGGPAAALDSSVRSPPSGGAAGAAGRRPASAAPRSRSHRVGIVI